jgi:hypothetical protein
VRATWSGGQLQAHHFAPVTRLSYRASLGWLPLVATLLGAVAGGCGGGVLLRGLYPDQSTPATIALGSVAAAALAAFGSYWSICLLQALFGAWWQAHRHGRGS